MDNQNKNDGWPEHFHLFPRLDRVCEFIGRILRPLHTETRQFVPFEEPNYWKAAEELHTTGAESDSIMESFE